MSATPTLDKYPLAHQAVLDVYAFNDGIGAPPADYVRAYEPIAAILDACLQEDALTKQDLIVVNILTAMSPAYYSHEKILRVFEIYGERIGNIVQQFSRLGDLDDLADSFPAVGYFNKAADIQMLEALPQSRLDALPDVYFTSYRRLISADLHSADPTIASLARREEAVLSRIDAARAAKTPNNAAAPQHKK